VKTFSFGVYECKRGGGGGGWGKEGRKEGRKERRTERRKEGKEDGRKEDEGGWGGGRIRKERGDGGDVLVSAIFLPVFRWKSKFEIYQGRNI
jgi:hypothetical protein